MNDTEGAEEVTAKEWAERRVALTRALVKARSEFPAIPKTRKAKIPTKSGGSYEYVYADLTDILSATMPVLNENGLTLTYDSTVDTKMVGIHATLNHVGGGTRTASVSLPYPNGTPQEMGSVLTYGRRYSTEMVLGIVCQDDDDGQLAQRATVHHQSLPTVSEPTIMAWIASLPESVSRAKVEKTLDRVRQDNGAILEEDFTTVKAAVAESIAKKQSET